MAKKGWTNLDGQLYLNLSTGDVQFRYGADGWFKKNLGNIKGTKVFKRIVDSHGTAEGKHVRRRAALTIMRNVKVSKAGVK